MAADAGAAVLARAAWLLISLSFCWPTMLRPARRRGGRGRGGRWRGEGVKCTVRTKSVGESNTVVTPLSFDRLSMAIPPRAHTEINTVTDARKNWELILESIFNTSTTASSTWNLRTSKKIGRQEISCCLHIQEAHLESHWYEQLFWIIAVSILQLVTNPNKLKEIKTSSLLAVWLLNTLKLQYVKSIKIRWIAKV